MARTAMKAVFALRRRNTAALPRELVWVTSSRLGRLSRSPISRPRGPLPFDARPAFMNPWRSVIMPLVVLVNLTDPAVMGFGRTG